MKNYESVQTSIKNNDMIRITTNAEFNTLSAKPQLYALIKGARTKTIKMKLTGLYRDSEGTEYISFVTEEPINDRTVHNVEFRNETFNDIYDYDIMAVDKAKNDFANINRVAIDRGYAGLDDFLSTYNSMLKELPERMI